MAQINPNLVKCPTCGSPAGWPCKTAQGAQLVGDVHDSRKDLAKS